ncbi:MAG: hypothetical protein E3J71_07860 [Candidatus Stahlbacteria bacterium]|nr:MAG: hypothetical protein E3J71_07860 [Candidatus Stahlbacteria bacterium]
MIKKSVFMVMPFEDKNAQEIYEHCTKKVCEKFGLEIRRADELFTTNVILDDILEEIKNASVIIVDISGKNANVFYELGMAHILKPQQTIMITNEPPHDAPFDIQHFRIIHYDNTVKGGKLFEDKLAKTLENLLQDYGLLYEDEFEFLANFLGTPLLFDLLITEQLPLLSHPHKGERIAYKCSSQDMKSSGTFPLGDSEQFEDWYLDSLIKMKYVTKHQNLVLLTEKGKAFVSYLEKKGFACKIIKYRGQKPPWSKLD